LLEEIAHARDCKINNATCMHGNRRGLKYQRKRMKENKRARARAK
jgi:hypothetical protein